MYNTLNTIKILIFPITINICINKYIFFLMNRKFNLYQTNKLTYKSY